MDGQFSRFVLNGIGERKSGRPPLRMRPRGKTFVARLNYKGSSSFDLLRVIMCVTFLTHIAIIYVQTFAFVFLKWRLCFFELASVL